MTKAFPLQRYLDMGRNIGLAFKEYEVSTDMFRTFQVFVEPADVPVLKKYFHHIIKETDYADPAVQKEIMDRMDEEGNIRPREVVPPAGTLVVSDEDDCLGCQ